MNSIDLTLLPESLEDIVHKYHHQLKYVAVMDELLFVSKTLQQKCGSCKKEFVSFFRCECIDHKYCGNTFCDECQKMEIRHEYEHFMMDATEEDYETFCMTDFAENVIENMECDKCLYLSHQMVHNREHWEELQEMEDTYGYHGGW